MRNSEENINSQSNLVFKSFKWRKLCFTSEFAYACKWYVNIYWSDSGGSFSLCYIFYQPHIISAFPHPIHLEAFHRYVRSSLIIFERCWTVCCFILESICYKFALDDNSPFMIYIHKLLVINSNFLIVP